MFTNDFKRTILTDMLIAPQTAGEYGRKYLALFTAAPTKAGTYSGEPTGAQGYQRVDLTDLLQYQPASATVANHDVSLEPVSNVAILFPPATTNWGTITHFGVFGYVDDGSSHQETLLCAGELSTPVAVTQGQVPLFKDNALQFSFTGI